MFLKQSTAVDVMLGPFVDDTDGKTTEEALTLAQADLQLSKNCGAAAQKNEGTSATHLYGGNYKVPLNTTDTETLGHLRLMCKESGALPVKEDFMVVPANVYDSLVGGSDTLNADVTQWSGSNVATPTVAGVPEVDVTYIEGTVHSGATMRANVIQISGDTTAADNLGLDYDGTGYAKANSTIGTCTTNTDMRGTDSAALASVCTETRLAELDAANLPADIDAIAGYLDTEIAAILEDTGTTLAAQIAALNDISVADIIAGVADGSYDLQEMLRVIFSVCAGKSAGGGTATLTFRDSADSKNRVSATVDANGNRTAMTLDAS